MKKKLIIYTTLISAFFAPVSCNMDLTSPDSMPYDRAFESIQNVAGLEKGLYARVRTAYSLESMIVPDLQADYINPINGFSNTFGNIYNWTYTQEESEVSVVWQNYYAIIGHANFMIDGIDSKVKFEVLPGSEEQKILSRAQGAAYFARALSYSVLAERFCADYDEATAKNQYTGLPLALKYDPNNIPDRSTLYDVYEQINKDLKKARDLMKGIKGAKNSTVFNLDCISLLELRILLQTDRHKDAYDKAMEFISSASAYSLVDSEEAFKEMWMYDRSPETIFQFYASKTELAYQWGYYFSADNFNGLNAERLMIPDYIPSKACLDQYVETDWRRKAYFLRCSSLELGEDGVAYLPLLKGPSVLADEMYVIWKFPGNPDLRPTKEWNYANTYKVFRLAEAYLIAAEAAAVAGEDVLTPLNTLRQHRGLQPLDKAGLAEVQAERYREMIFEGTRLTDLKRWGMDLKRGEPQTGLTTEDGGQSWNEDYSFITEVNSDLTVPKSDYRFVWPLPSSEIFAHPPFASQQNPGWRR